MTRTQQNILAAILATSDMGQATPKVEAVARLAKLNNISLSGAVLACAGSYMESDEHQEIFEGQARYFFKQLKNEAKCRQAWPDVFKLYESAEAHNAV